MMSEWIEKNSRATKFFERDNRLIAIIGGEEKVVGVKATEIPQPWDDDTQKTLPGMDMTREERLRDKVNVALDRIRTAHDMSMRYLGSPLAITFSGGKDSDVLIELARMSGRPVIFHNSHTTVDAPETVYYIRWEVARLREEGYQARTEYPDTSMWKLIVKMNGCPPLRTMRYCCAHLKERKIMTSDGKLCFIATGVRWAESVARKSREVYEVQGSRTRYAIHVSEEELMLHNDNTPERRLFEECKAKGARVVNPIIDWTDSDVWEFLRWRGCYANVLYSQGKKRVGCIGCPCARKGRGEDFERWPRYKRAYIAALERGFDRAREVGRPNLLESVGGEGALDFMESGLNLREFLKSREQESESGMGCSDTSLGSKT